MRGQLFASETMAMRTPTLLLLTLAAVPRPSFAETALPPFAPLPPGFTANPDNIVVEEFGHHDFVWGERAAEHKDVEGKRINYTAEGTASGADSAAAAIGALKSQLSKDHWELLNHDEGRVVARRDKDGHQLWLDWSSFGFGDNRIDVVESGGSARALALDPPSGPATDIAEDQDKDFPFLSHFPGTTLVDTTLLDGPLTVPAEETAQESLVIDGKSVQKNYKGATGASLHEFIAAYGKGLAKAGWKIVNQSESNGGGLTAHYSGNGRELWAALSFFGNDDIRFVVADPGSARLAARLATELRKEGHVALYGIRFDTGSARIRPDSEPILVQIGALLASDPSLKLIVEGHTDGNGLAAANQKLSQARAEAVKKYLVDHGAVATRLTPHGYGDTNPLGDNHTPEGRARNRRVELAVLGNETNE